jgi:hypothetical protein
MVMTLADPIPDAVAALIAAVIEDNPFAPPRRQGLLVVEALRREGWRISAPARRGTRQAVPAVSAQTAAETRAAVRHHPRAERPSTEDVLSEMRHA